MKIDKSKIGIGFWLICVGFVMLIYSVNDITSFEFTIIFFILSNVILFAGIANFLQGIKLNKNEVLK